MLKTISVITCTALLGACTLKINHSPDKFRSKFGSKAKPIVLPLKLSDSYKNLLAQSRACYENKKLTTRVQHYRNGMAAGYEVHERTYGVKTEESGGKKTVFITYDYYVPGLVKNKMKSFVAIAELSSVDGKTTLIHYQKHKAISEAIEAWASGEKGHACPTLGQRMHYSETSSEQPASWLVASDDPAL